MVVLNHFFTSVYLAIVYASLVIAAPRVADRSFNIGTHRVHKIGKRAVEIVAFSPRSKFEVFDDGIEHPNSDSFGDVTLEESTIAFVSERLDVEAESIGFKQGFTDDGTSYAYVQQKHDGIAFANSVGNVAFRNKKVVAFGSSFVNPTDIADSTPTVPLDDAIATAEEALNGTKNDIAPKLEYVALEDGSAILAHVFQIQNDEQDIFYEAFVDAHTGELRSIIDFVAQAAYRVLPFDQTYPTESPFKLITDPQTPVGSPFGWHSDGVKSTNDTSGNNVITYKGDISNTSVQSASGLIFDYSPDFTASPFTDFNIHAARVNTFYIVNTLHDLWHLYGFTEGSFNFQDNNFGIGGADNDRVLVSVQDASGFNNANFATPPDGQNGRMRMYIWRGFDPLRDGDLENDIVIHEYMHGMTNRLTGGGAGRCLSTLESGGLGEGWSDAMADWASVKGSVVQDFTLGSWANGRNIRRYPYSTNPAVNRLKYSSLRTSSGVHGYGEIWANLLHNVHAEMVAANGFDSEARTNPYSKSGNAMWLHIVIDALKLQPCNPSFVDAKKALMQADANRYQGRNRCIISQVFARRGLGEGAVSGNYTDEYSVAVPCRPVDPI